MKLINFLPALALAQIAPEAPRDCGQYRLVDRNGISFNCKSKRKSGTPLTLNKKCKSKIEVILTC